MRSEQRANTASADKLSHVSAAHQRHAVAKDRVRGVARRTFSRNVLSELGGFAGLFALDTAKFPEPILVASADGVGSKLQLAARLGLHGSVAGDLVNHCVNDLLVEGATPLFFLDHISAGELNAEVVGQIASGLVDACRANGLALLGGETAEMPLLYRSKDDYELAGFAVGVVDRCRRLDPNRIAEGDALLALPSTGLHTEGYALAQRLLFTQAGYRYDEYIPALCEKVGAALMKPHRSYLTPVRRLHAEELVRGLAHITGGGLAGTLPRILPRGLAARVDLRAWEPPPLFAHLAELGALREEEMHATFNMGVGLVAVVPARRVPEARKLLGRMREPSFVLGSVVASGSPEVQFVR